jgi:hypothetical protein
MNGNEIPQNLELKHLSSEILGDVKVWSDKFKSLDGLYLDPVGVQLRGADLHNLLTNISKFIRDNIYDHKGT